MSMSYASTSSVSIAQPIPTPANYRSGEFPDADPALHGWTMSLDDLVQLD
jgi:hypothetical protein